MSEQDWLAQRFEEHRRRLRAVAYRMLGSAGHAAAGVVATRNGVVFTIAARATNCRPS
jgi:hypothetical protein